MFILKSSPKTYRFEIWEKFTKSGSIIGDVPNFVAASWERCVESNLDPLGMNFPQKVLLGDELNHLLKFRRKTLQDYYDAVRRGISPVQRFLIGLVPKMIVRNYLMRMSDPLKAIRENNFALIERYYGSRQHFEKLAWVDGGSE